MIRQTFMADRSVPRDLIESLIRDLKRRGVDYADVRWERLLHEHLLAEQGCVTTVSLSESAGIGIRVLLKGSWGFASTPHVTKARLARTVADAIDLARASAAVNKQPRPLAPVEPVKARHRSPCAVDPFDVPLSKKLDYLLWANQALLGPDAIRRASSHMDFFKRRKLFCSTDGAQIEQVIVESGAGLEVVAQSGGEVQTRSFPNSHHGALAQAGFEYVKRLDLVGGASTAREEALHLLRAKPPRAGQTTVILHPTQVVMQLHESCGHPAELDRVLGQELSYAGGSFLIPEALNRLQYGSRLVNIIADATVASGVGSFGFDDEGVPARRVELVRDGRFVGYLSSRESAARLKLPSSGGMMRADGWSVPPLIRMTNVNLEPGEGTLEELMRNVKRGYLLSTNKSWSIDDRRLNFQFTTEIGWEILEGRLGAIVKNPLYTGMTPQFWGRCTGVGRREDWQLWGVPNCAKGEPMQLMHVGHGAPYARFDHVSVAAAT
ncbi:MAG: TldD/PmbA family protein [Candidatus Omnitrophica bacterium]|nr:TldD/PmbA family protein [Candidatus Omnitrophota bacterium]